MAATNTAAVGTNTEQTIEADAVQIDPASDQQASDDSQVEGASADDDGSGAQEKKPEVDETAKRLVELSQRQAQLQTAIRVNQRQREALEKREAGLVARERALQEGEARRSGLRSFSEVSDFIARERGITVDQLHAEWSSELKNGGRPTADVEARRIAEDAKRRLDSFEQKQREQAEQYRMQQIQRERAQWGDEIESVLGLDGDPTRVADAKSKWPRLAAQPPVSIRAVILAHARQYMAENDGELPDRDELLNSIEQLFPETIAEQVQPKTPASNGQTGTKPKPKGTPGKGPPNTRALTEDERRAAAIALLDSYDAQNG